MALFYQPLLSLHIFLIKWHFLTGSYIKTFSCHSRSEVEAEDEVDSDFSIDENDEPVSDTEDPDGTRPQKRGHLVTKAYKVRAWPTVMTHFQIGLLWQCLLVKYIDCS